MRRFFSRAGVNGVRVEAKGIAGGDWLGHGVFYQAPHYPYFLALVYRVFNDSVATVRVIQALLGACSCILLSVAGIQLFGRRGAIAGILLAIYPPAVFQDGLIDKSSLATFLAAALLALLSAPAERMTARRRFGAGIVLGLLSLTLGRTLASQGRIAEAVPHFERALALDPNYANARASLDEARAIHSRTSRR